MSTLIHKWVSQCRDGSNPRVISRLASGWAVLGEAQFLRGYCLVLPDPVVPHLNSLSGSDRIHLMQDVMQLGDAVLAVTGALRCNYEILGNLEPALHVHVFPRFNHEPEALRSKPVWFYDWNNGPRFAPEEYRGLMLELRRHLQRSGTAVG